MSERKTQNDLPSSNMNIEQQSLRYMNMLVEALEDARSTSMYLDDTVSVINPSELLEQIEDLTKLIEKVDMTVNAASVSAKNLIGLYRNAFAMFEKNIDELIDRVNGRENLPNQMNTSVEFSQSEVRLSDYKVGNDVVTINEVKEPGEYSVLSIINRLRHEDPTRIEALQDYIWNCFNRTDIAKDISNRVTKNFRKLSQSTKFFETMSTDISTEECLASIHTLQKSVKALIYNIEIARKKSSEMFSIYLMMRNNLVLYNKAVDAITEITLESTFNGVPFEILS